LHIAVCKEPIFLLYLCVQEGSSLDY